MSNYGSDDTSSQGVRSYSTSASRDHDADEYDRSTRSSSGWDRGDADGEDGAANVALRSHDDDENMRRVPNAWLEPHEDDPADRYGDRAAEEDYEDDLHKKSAEEMYVTQPHNTGHRHSGSSPSDAAPSETRMTTDRQQGPRARHWERLYREGVERQARRQSLHQHAEELRRLSELVDDTDGSYGVKAGATYSRDFHERQLQWLEDLEIRRRVLKEAAELEELRTLRDPALNKKSLGIANQLGYAGPVTGWDVHFARFCVRDEVELPGQLFQPNINVHTAHVPRGKPFGERLYDESKERRTKLKVLEKKQRQAEVTDPATGQPFFKPYSYAKGGDGATGHPKPRTAQQAAEVLYQKALEQRESLKRLAAKSEEKLTFQPSINPASREMQVTRPPLYERRPRPPPPAVFAKPTKIDMTKFLLRSERMLARREMKVQALQNQRQQRDTAECTFHPRVSRRSLELFDSSQQRWASEDDVRGASIAPRGPGYEGLLYGTPMHVDAGGPLTSSALRRPVSRTHERAVSVRFAEDGAADQYHQSPAPRYPQERMESGHHPLPPSRGDIPVATAHEVPPREGASARIDVLDGDAMIDNFEKKMREVLSEWKRLEDV